MASADSFGRHAALDDARADAKPAAPDEVAEKKRDLQALFQAHYASIWRLLRRLGVPSGQLDDAAQEVFWVAARKLAAIEAGREHAFLYGVALRIASNWLRRQQAAPRFGEWDEAHQAIALGPSPEEELAQRRARVLLDAVLERMPLELRTVFVLFELEGLPVKEIAELEDVPLGTASSRLRRAREEFSAIAKRVRAQLLREAGGVR